LAETGPCAAGLKWPNDLRIGKRKAGGILCEYEPAGGPPAAVVVGVGINLGGGKDNFPLEIRDKTTSLEAECGRAVRPDTLLGVLLDRLWERYLRFIEAGFSQFRERWMELCDNLGENVALPAKGGEMRGRIAGIDDTGRLLLTRPDGSPFAVEAGEVREE
ncbi:MAG: biotin--[acetyl-CoA-carboxylase] ligase, partial [bacterium]|nr:biotin--[acetyl-CoA-carboxylase] ligase [bacterium]